jgi:hypothetical protein
MVAMYDAGTRTYLFQLGNPGDQAVSWELPNGITPAEVVSEGVLLLSKRVSRSMEDLQNHQKQRQGSHFICLRVPFRIKKVSSRPQHITSLDYMHALGPQPDEDYYCRKWGSSIERGSKH